MASERNTELKNMSIEDLQSELLQVSTDFDKMKYDHAVKGLDNPLELRSVRRDVARVKTEIRRRELAEYTPEDLTGRTKLISRRRKQRSK